AHSASRATVLSVPGAINTPPTDQTSHNSGTTNTTPTRRTHKRRRVGRDALRRCGRRCAAGVST
ncbi:MAG: hypothetical protein ACYDDW_18670, partial [Dermatophilaceae bacterium]